MIRNGCAVGSLFDDLERTLGTTPDVSARAAKELTLDPTVVLEVLEQIELAPARAITSVRSAYDAARTRCGAPPFDDIVARGIVRVVWDVVRWPWDLCTAVNSSSGPLAVALREIVDVPDCDYLRLSTAAAAKLLRDADRRL